MAELRSTTAIGGNIIWHGGNLRFDPQGETVLYDGYKVYTENDKPDPHTDLTESVVKRSGDTMTGTLNIRSKGELIDLTDPSLASNDAWISMGNVDVSSSTYAWQIRYMGTTSGVDGNELRFASTHGSSPKYWQMDHLGNFEYFDGSAIQNMLHTGNINSTLDGRYVNVTGDTMTGKLTLTKNNGSATVGQLAVQGAIDHTSGISISGNTDSGGQFSTRIWKDGQHLAFSDESGANKVRILRDIGGIDTTSHIYAGGYVSAERLYASTDRKSGYFYQDTTGRTSFVNGSFYIQASSPITYLYSPVTYLGNQGSKSEIRVRANRMFGDTWDFPATGGLKMSSNITFRDEGTGLRGASDQYFLNFNQTDIHMSSLGDVTIEADSNDNETARFLNLRSGLNTLKIAGGAMNTASAMKFNDNIVLHVGNFSTHLDGRYVNATGDTMTGDLNMGNSKIVGSTSTYFLNLMGGRTASTLQSASTLIIQADVDGSGAPEGIELRSGVGSKNILRIDSTTGSSNVDAMHYNGSTVQHDGRSEMKFDDGAASIEYDSNRKSIDFVFA